MSDTYIISPTDGNETRSFSISPYTNNGETSPISNVLDPSAVTADTSLLFLGRASNNYGERLQENFLHLLENFSSEVEPNNPVHGQLWFDKNDNTLKIFKTTELGIYDLDTFSLNTIIVEMKGNPNSTHFSKNRDALISRFSGGYKFNIYNVNGNLVGKFIATSSTPNINVARFNININTTTNVEVPSTPGVTPIIQTIGSWKSVQEVDPSVLNGALFDTFDSRVTDLDACNNNIINIQPMFLGDSSKAYYAVPKTYVDTNFVKNVGDSINGNLIVDGTLTVTGTSTFQDDVIINAPAILNMTGSKINNLGTPTLGSDAANKNYVDNNFVELSGDIMTGVLTLNAQPQQNGVGGTKAINDAATVGYIDDEITTVMNYINTQVGGIGGIPAIGGLTDVVITSVGDGDILLYDSVSGNWVNTAINDANTLNGFSDTDFVKKSSGGTISSGGVLKILGQPGQLGNIGTPNSEDAASVSYVNNIITTNLTSLLPNGDIYVVGGNYDAITDALNLNRSGGQPDVVITGLAAGIGTNVNSTATINHNIIPSGVGDTLEAVFADNPAYPNIVLTNILETISAQMRVMQSHNVSEVYTSTNGSQLVYDLNTLLGITYTGGFHSLQIYVNGQKQIVNRRGFIEIGHSTLSVYHSDSTGLNNDPTVYSFNISVDGGGAISINVTGSDCQNYKEMVNAINVQLALSGVAARAVVYEGVIAFFTDSSGNSSTISITDVNLVSSLSGFSIDTPTNGVTYDYEENAKYGDTNGSIVNFTTGIPVGSLIEFVVINAGGATDINGFEV